MTEGVTEAGLTVTAARAAVLAGPGRVAIRRTPLGRPGPRQLRVRVEGCGVCGSNVPPWRGAPWFEYPFPAGAPGHEAWGVVEAVGPAVAGIGEGDRVALLHDAAFADRVLVEYGAAVRLPPELDGRPFPGEALACAMNVLERSGIRPGDSVAIVGVGFLGALLIQLAAAAGARVLALSRRAFARGVALRCGADVALDPAEPDAAVAAVEAANDGSLCDVVIEATGKQGPLDLAARLARVRGRLVIAGYHQDGRREIDLQLWNWRGLDVINAHERDPERYRAGIRAAIRATLDGRLRADGLITHTYPLQALEAALDAAAERPEGFLKAVVEP